MESLQIKLRTDVADRLGADCGMFHAGMLEIPIRMIQSVGDAVVLSVAGDKLRQVLPGANATGAPRVLTAEDGLEAVDRALSNPPDLIIANADLAVPAAEAGTLLAYLAGDPRVCAVPVLAMVESDRTDLPAARIRILPKPFDEGRLLRAVEDIIGPNRATPPEGIHLLGDSEEVTRRSFIGRGIPLKSRPSYSGAGRTPAPEATGRSKTPVSSGSNGSA